MEATVICLVNTRLLASYTYLWLGFYTDHSDVALEDMGHFCELAEEKKQERAQCLLKMQNQHCSCTLFQDMQKPSQDEWGKTQDAMEATLLKEKNLTQPFWICMAWVLPSQTPTSVTSWRDTS